jgi:hypothetical protein
VSHVPLAVVQGEPLTVKTTVIGGQTRWPNGHVIKGQIATRAGGALLFDLAPHVTSVNVDEDDIEFTLTLTGAETRQIARSGAYDVFVTEPGAPSPEATALRILHGPAMVEFAVTP